MINGIVINIVVDGVAQIKTIPQVEAALGFFALVGPDLYDVADFETKCGVGMEMTFSNDSICVNLVWWSGSEFVTSIRSEESFFVMKSMRRAMFMLIRGIVLELVLARS